MTDLRVRDMTGATVADLIAGLLYVVKGAGGNLKAAAQLFWHSGNILEVTTTGTTAVGADVTAVRVILPSSGAVTLTLAAVSARNGLPLKIVDWGGNADITLTPNGTEKIMGLSSAELISAGQGLGTGTNITLDPDTNSPAGWF